MERRTGKTTRMLRKAIELAKDGRAVYVIAANGDEQKRLRQLLPEDLGIKVETPNSLPNFDWPMGTNPGSHPNCVWLADHFAAEAKIRERVQEAMNRLDEAIGISRAYLESVPPYIHGAIGELMKARL